MVLFGIHGHSERICHLLDINDVRHGVIVYIDIHMEDVHDAPHGVVHATSINVNAEVFF